MNRNRSNSKERPSEVKRTSQPGTPKKSNTPQKLNPTPPKAIKSPSGSNIKSKVPSSPKNQGQNRSNSGQRQSSNSPSQRLQAVMATMQQQQTLLRAGPGGPPRAQQTVQESGFQKVPFNGHQSKFQDDSTIIKPSKLIKEQKAYDNNKNLHLDIRSKSKVVKLSESPQFQPVMITIRTEDEEDDSSKQPEIVQLQQVIEESKESAKNAPGQSAKEVPKSNRQTGIDLICVVDHSGSMSGVKIDLVRQTLCYVLDQLSSIDRLCIIHFDDKCDRLSPLVSVTEENKPALLQVIKKLGANGGTDINLGMNCAFEQLTQRNSENSVTSVFLLSDGLDGGAEQRVAQSLFQTYPTLKEKVFTIHTFGFGSDHDPKLMNSIASLKDGNFYFIQDLTKLDECFVDALAALFSVVAQDITIETTIVQKPDQIITPECNVTYGNMWVKQTPTLFNIKIPQLMSGVSKDFLLELQIPGYSKGKFGDNQRNIEVLIVKLVGTQLNQDGQKVQFTKVKNLMLTLYNQDENVGDVDEDGEVMENYCRVQAAQAINQALEEGNKGNYEGGQVIINQALEKIDMMKKNKKGNLQKMEVLEKDLIQTKEQCNPKTFQSYGKHNMIMLQKCHMEQRSKGAMVEGAEEDNLYGNLKQKAMVKACKSKRG